MRPILALLLSVTVAAGCTNNRAGNDPAQEPLADLGAFKLGHNVVVTSKMKKGPVSREATEEEWKTALSSAIANRFSQYQGDEFYHTAISVEHYTLAPPGVPFVFTPKSVLIINFTVWDDAAGKKLNEEVKQLTILETTSGESALAGSGLSRSKEEQIAGLSRNAVRQMEKWMVEQRAEKGWFGTAPSPETLDIEAVATQALE